MLKKVIAVFLLIPQIFICGCVKSTPAIATVAGKSSYSEKGVSITNMGAYYNVVLDYTTGISHKEMGEAFARGILKVVPDYAKLLDSYISEINNNVEYHYGMYNVDGLKAQLDGRYTEEIDGLSSVISGKAPDKRNDGRISKKELYLFNLLADIGQGTQCSFVSVYGKRSSTGSTIAGRNLDWFGGSKNQISQIQSVTTFIYPHRKICSIGYLGYMGILTGFNDRKDFAAILLSPTGQAYDSQGKRSFALDLRTALLKCDSINGIADFMESPKRCYASNHIIALSDPKKSVILENNFSGFGTNNMRVRRALRTADSKLNKGESWGISDAVGSVNSFMLYGNYDNHTRVKYNTKRWATMKNLLFAAGPKVTPKEIEGIISYNKGSPGTSTESGCLYNRETTQMIMFEPESLTLEVFFRPKDSERNPECPIFKKVPAFGGN